MFRFKSLLGAAFLAAGCAFGANAQDHPLLGSFEGSQQVGYQLSEYDETNIIVGPISDAMMSEQSGPGWQTVEGRIYHLYYRLPDGRTSLEALRNYEQSLRAGGFDIAFSCSTEGGTCFLEGKKWPGVFLGVALDGSTDLPKLDAGDFVRNFFNKGNGRYLLAKLNRPEGTVYASLAFSDDAARGRYVFARVIETTEMETGMISFKEASEIQHELLEQGASNIYGIHFDFDKSDIKPESAPQMKAIADLLRENPNMRVDIAGHTDDQGGTDYNLDLSARRANAVVDELATTYQISRDRLAAVGKGPREPVASNQTDAGRAQNRRVELVRR